MDPSVQFSQRAAWAEGQPISELMARALAHPELISLAAGFVDQVTLPVEATQSAFEDLFRSRDISLSALQYGSTQGYPLLREQLVERLHQEDSSAGLATATSVDDVVVTAGSNQLLHLVGECLLNPGDIVLCAAPTYLVFLGTLSNLGAVSRGVASDEKGLIPEALEERLRQIEASGDLPRVKAIYVVSSFDNPRGISLPAERREAIVEIAKRWSRSTRIHVIEDAAYRELRYSADDIPSMRAYDEEGDTVVLAGTFSKSFSPGIRVGWGILPRHLVEPLCNQKGNIDFGSPNFSQQLMSKVLEMDLYDPHVQKIRREYKKKLDAMLAAAERCLTPLGEVTWTQPHGGLYIWVTLPESIDTGPHGLLFDQAIREGMLYVPGRFAYPLEGEPANSHTMRLSFGVQTTERISEGVESLARAIEQVRKE